jgi:hypothetical protein
VLTLSLSVRPLWTPEQKRKALAVVTGVVVALIVKGAWLEVFIHMNVKCLCTNLVLKAIITALNPHSLQ